MGVKIDAELYSCHGHISGGKTDEAQSFCDSKKKKKIPIFTWMVAAVHVRSGSSVLNINLVSFKTSKFEGHQVIAEKHLLQLLFPP